MQPVEVRTYKGRTQADAAAVLARDSATMAGYMPTSQSWSPPRLVAVYLAPFIFIVAGYLIFGVGGAALGGIIGIVGFLFERPRAKGSLTVTWTRR